jgi:hypothetical protein
MVLWKRGLQDLANELGIAIAVHHLPPGTSKWNKIEHRLFSFISMNWKAQPLVSYRVIVDLIGATTTRTGLTVRCELDSNVYPKGIVVSDQEYGKPQHHPKCVPRRVELHHPPRRNSNQSDQYQIPLIVTDQWDLVRFSMSSIAGRGHPAAGLAGLPAGRIRSLGHTGRESRLAGIGITPDET